MFDIKGMDATARIQPDGTVIWIVGGQYKTLCPVDVRKYPLDVQTCTIDISKWFSDDTMQEFVPTTGAISLNEASSTSWRPVRTGVRLESVEYNGTIHTRCVYSLMLAREPVFVMLNIILPILLLSFLNVFVFKLPAASGEKMTLCISVLISFAVFSTAINGEMPKVGNKISYLEIFLSFQLAISGLTIVLTVWILHLYNKPTTDSVSHAWLLSFLCCSTGGKCPRRQDSFKTTDNTAITWEGVAKSLDVSFFWIFLFLATVSTVIFVILIVV